MIEAQATKDAFCSIFSNIIDIGDGVLRGERIFHQRPYAIGYLDLSDDLINRARDLSTFQENLIGADFFSLPDELRWSNYYFFLAGPQTLGNKGYLEAKNRIEADREYARKFVLSEEESLHLLSLPGKFNDRANPVAGDVMQKWEEHLRANGLGLLLQRPTSRSAVLDKIAQGTALGQQSTQSQRLIAKEDIPLATRHLRSLKFKAGRGVHDGRQFAFGAVNLIIGPNGSGKTSLLEALEYFYCGNNRRGGLQSSFQLEATLAQPDGSIVSLKSTTDSARIKARNSAWYRKEEHQAKGILQGFTRYNFLDTDAAFRISTELDPDKLNDDISKLLIGSEPSLLWEYISKILQDLAVRGKDLARLVESEEGRVKLLGKELDDLVNMPSEASSLAKNFVGQLQLVGWKKTWGEDGILVAQLPREVFAEPLDVVGRLRSEGVAHESTYSSVCMQVQELTQLDVEISPLMESRQVARDELAKAVEEIRRLSKDAKALSEWQSYGFSGFPKAIERHLSAETELHAARAHLGTLTSIQRLDLPDGYSDKPVAVAFAELMAERRSVGEALENLRRTLSQESKNAASFANSMRDLQEAAASVIATMGARHCPVCSTIHERDELLLKVNGLARAYPVANGATSVSLREMEQREVSLANAGELLGRIRIVCGHFDLDERTSTCAEVVGRFNTSCQRLKDAKMASTSALESVTSLEAAGLSRSRYSSLKTELERFGPIALADLGAVERILVNTKASLDSSEHQAARLQKKSIEIDALIIERVTPLAESTRSMVSAEKADVFVRLHLQWAERAKKEWERLWMILGSDEERALSFWQQALTQILEAYDKVVHATQREANASRTIAAKRQEFKVASASVVERRDELQRSRQAYGNLNRLRSDFSLSSANLEVLDAIRTQINDIFTRIHSPREYEFPQSGNALLTNRKSGSPQSLEHVSTGQRAAFALSIFLSLNATASHAPPILLIDDPVAHIDDLNALSLLDYLRDIALEGNKQIFFATADTRLAALFQKKFEFLGQDKFAKIVLHRRAVA